MVPNDAFDGGEHGGAVLEVCGAVEEVVFNGLRVMTARTCRRARAPDTVEESVEWS